MRDAWRAARARRRERGERLHERAVAARRRRRIHVKRRAAGGHRRSAREHNKAIMHFVHADSLTKKPAAVCVEITFAPAPPQREGRNLLRPQWEGRAPARPPGGASRPRRAATARRDASPHQAARHQPPTKSNSRASRRPARGGRTARIGGRSRCTVGRGSN